MPRGNEKFIRRQKEIARQQKQEEKRRAKASRKTDGSSSADDEIAAIQAALDAGLNPGSAEARAGEGDPGEDEAGDAGSEAET